MQEILSVFGIDWKLLAIQGFNFSVLLLALWYFLYRPVVRMIEERQAKIEAGVRDSEAAAMRLREVEAAEKDRLSKAESEAGAIVDRAKAHAKTEGERLVSESRAQSERLLAEAKKRAEEEKNRALKEQEKEVARLAVLAAEKVLQGGKN